MDSHRGPGGIFLAFWVPRGELAVVRQGVRSLPMEKADGGGSGQALEMVLVVGDALVGGALVGSAVAGRRETVLRVAEEIVRAAEGPLVVLGCS